MDGKSFQKIMVFGGSGFLGARFLEMAPENMEIHSTYFGHPLSRKNIKEHKLDLLDVQKTERLIREINPDIIFHTAKSKSFDLEPEESLASIKKIAELSKLMGILLVYVSTDSVFDGQKGEYKEKDPTNPINDYGRGKEAAEKMIKGVSDNFIIIRTSYIYGRSNQKLDRRTEELLGQLKKSQEIFRFQDMIRSVTFVDDLAQASWKLIKSDFRGIIHIAGEKLSMFDFAVLLAKSFGLDSSLVRPNSLKGLGYELAPDTSLNTDLAKSAIGFKYTKLPHKF